MYAHYFASRNDKQVVISTTPDLSGNLSTVSITRVSGKRQAREIARKNNAQCWNF